MKLSVSPSPLSFRLVAPFVGAWIETEDKTLGIQCMAVAPFVGAWIETPSEYPSDSYAAWSLPSWERGLKLKVPSYSPVFHNVAPFVGAWIETT